MPAPRSGAWPWIIAGALSCCAVLGPYRNAGAATTSYEVSGQGVVQVIGRGASITIRTWNRNTVQIDWPNDTAFVSSKSVQGTPASFPIPTVSVEEAYAAGTIVATLLPEDFPAPKLTPGLIDVVRVEESPHPPRAGKPPALIVTIPESTGLVNVRSGKGALALRDYRGTTIATLGRGRVVFDNLGGDAFVQLLNGHFYARNSSFDRLRIRSNRADQIFERCRVKQIEATSLTGNILFDDGVFDPGLARFESDRGSIALGVNGDAQIGAHTTDGHVRTTLPPVPSPPSIDRYDRPGRDEPADGDRLQQVGNGGPLVSASSNHGDIFLYDGSLTDRRPAALPPAWQPMYNLLVPQRPINRRVYQRRIAHLK